MNDGNIFAWTDTNVDQPNYVSINKKDDKVTITVRGSGKSYQINTPSAGTPYNSIVEIPHTTVEISMSVEDFMKSVN